MALRNLIIGTALLLGGCSGTMAADKHASFYHCDSGQVTTEELRGSASTGG